MERINIKQEVISISDDEEIDIKKEPTVRLTPPKIKSGLNGIIQRIYKIDIIWILLFKSL